MATQPAPIRRPAPVRFGASTPPRATRAGQLSAASPSRSRPRPASPSRRSVNLPGCAVALAPEIPIEFGDGGLEPHHRLVGRFFADRVPLDALYSRPEARRFIETAFTTAVLDILRPIDMVDLRAVVLIGDDDLRPAIVLICDDVGQLNLGWIESSELCQRVAPVGWRAAAYKALETTLNAVLPVSDYEFLFEEISAYWWDGAETDDEARAWLIDWHGAESEEEMADMLPSTFHAKRPEFMTAAAAPLKDMPAGLRQRLRKLRDTHAAVKAADGVHAWRYDTDELHSYLPGIEDISTVPPLTIVPFDQYARELDGVCRAGMELGFADTVGLVPLDSAATVADWFASVRRGADFLIAVQDLINTDPFADGAPS